MHRSARWQSTGTWLGLLLVLVFALNTAGGWVRLSGAGVAIPHWPIINLGSHSTVLPPWSDAEWTAAHAAWTAHQEVLAARVARGELHQANLGRSPRDAAEFRGMFLTEWSHRLLAAVTGLVAAVLLVTVLRDGMLRRAIGLPYGLACLLIIAQAVIGGVLVSEGTNTPWLWLHQGNAGLIMIGLLWSLLVVLAGGATPLPGRRGLLVLAVASVVLCWSQLVAGALVSGSKTLEGGYISRDLLAIGNLWQVDAAWYDNLTRNPGVAQWLHRWMSWMLTVVLLALALVVHLRPTGLRARLLVQVMATFIGVQMLLGMASGNGGSMPLLVLAHQATGMCLLLTVAAATFDLFFEPAGRCDDVPASLSPSAPS